MRIYRPKFRDRRTGLMKETRTWHAIFTDHRYCRRRMALPGCLTEKDARLFARRIERLIDWAQQGMWPSEYFRHWLRGLPANTLARLIDFAIIRPEHIPARVSDLPPPRLRRPKRKDNPQSQSAASPRLKGLLMQHAINRLKSLSLLKTDEAIFLHRLTQQDIAKSVRGLRRMDSLPRLFYPPVVYFLFDKGTLVYIGSTSNLYARLQEHARDKRFDSVTWVPVYGTDSDRKAVEHALQRYFGFPQTGRGPHLRSRPVHSDYDVPPTT